jgi:radical SAM protein with 4Fe4S-binding SPASM domain
VSVVPDVSEAAVTFTRPFAAGAVPPIRLREIDFNVTNLCNLACRHCSYSSTPDKQEPTLAGDVVHRVLDEAASMGNRVVHWSGGEAAVRPDIGDLIEHASRLGFGMRLLSNGILLSEERLERLRTRGLNKIFVSLDGLEANHDWHRASPGLFAKTMRGIRNSVDGGFDTRVNAVATTRNLDDFPELLRMLADIGVDTFTVFYLIPVGRGREIADLAVPPRRWRQFVDDLRHEVADLGPTSMQVTVEKVFWWDDEWNEDGIVDAGRGGGCLGFLSACDYVNILADGRVYPCVCFVDVAPPLGDVRERSLPDILHDPRGWAFYQSLTEMNPTCRSCDLVGACQGGNRAASMIASGDWFALDPRCSGDPQAQGFMPLCWMLREDLTTATRSGFAEDLSAGA